MTKLYDGQIADLIQNSANRNPEVLALSYAVLREKRRIMDHADETRTIAMIDTLPDKILDILAVELRTPAYSETFPIETKRELIKGTLNFYKKLGTPKAVNWVITAAFGNGNVEEWFDYKGEPHHFRVRIKNNGTFRTLDGLTEFIRTLDVVKRLSSWLDVIIVDTDLGPATLHIGGQMAAEVRLPLPVFPDSYDFRQRLTAGGQLTAFLQQPLPELGDSFDFRQDTHLGGAVSAMVEQGVPALPDSLGFEDSVRAGGAMASMVNQPLPSIRDSIGFEQTTQAGGAMAAQHTQPLPELQDSLTFRQGMQAGGQLAVQQSQPLPELPDHLTLRGGARAGGQIAIQRSQGVPQLQDSLTFRRRMGAGGQITAEQSQPVPELKDALDFSDTVRTGGTISASSEIPVPAVQDDGPTLTQTGRIGVGGTLKITVPLPELPQ